MNERNNKSKVFNQNIVFFKIYKKVLIDLMNLKTIDIQKNLFINGFRKGKVPLHIVQKMYNDKIFKTSIIHIMKENFLNCVKYHKINILKNTQYFLENFSNKEYFVFSVLFQECPYIDIKHLQTIFIESPVIQFSAPDKSYVLKKWYKKHYSWKSLLNKKIKKNYKVTIQCKTKVNNVYVKEYEFNNFSFIIDDSSIIKEVNNSLLGKRVGDVISVVKTFSKNYHLKFLREKTVQFRLKIREIKKKYISLSKKKSFLKKIKFYSLKKIKIAMQKQIKILKSEYEKKQLIENILLKSTISFSNYLIENENNNFYKEFVKNTTNNPFFLLKNHFYKLKLIKMKNNLVINLFLKKIIDENNISIKSEDIKSFFINKDSVFFNNYGLIKRYFSNKLTQKKINALILEEKAFSALLQLTKKKKKVMSFQKIIEISTKNEF